MIGADFVKGNLVKMIGAANFKRIGGASAAAAIFVLFNTSGSQGTDIANMKEEIRAVRRLERKFDVYVAVGGSEAQKAAVDKVEREFEKEKSQGGK